MTVRLEGLLAARVAEAPNRDALVDLAGASTLTWGAWARACDSLARELATAGFVAGDRVAVAAPRTADFACALLACWKVGLVAVPIDPASPPHERAGFLAHAEVRGEVGLDPSRVGAWVTVGGEGTVQGPTVPSPSDDALILYTSGSTGTPKAVRLTHDGVLSSLEGVTEAYRLGSHDRVLATLPLHTSHGLFVHLLAALVHGGTVLIAPHVGAFTARRFWALAEAQRATFFSSVPSVLSLLAAMAEGRPPRGLRLVSASAPLSADAVRALAERFGAPIMQSFGMSETSGWFLYGHAGQPDGTVGRPGRRAEVRVTAGQLEVRGAQVTPGYWKGGDARDSQGWMATGDCVREDAEGHLYSDGRLRRIIIRAGQNIHPEDLEAVLERHPEVLAAAVIGVPHALLGEVPRAFVVPRTDATPAVASLFACLRERLSAFRLPDRIEIVSALPMTRSGKVDYPALMRAAQDGGEASG